MTVRTARTRWLKYSQILLIGGALTAESAIAAAENARSDVEVNWGLLDRLGQESTLPQLLLRDEGKDTTAPPPGGPSPSVQFRPYRPGEGASPPPKAQPAPSRIQAPATDVGGPVYRPYQPKAESPKIKPAEPAADVTAPPPAAKADSLPVVPPVPVVPPPVAPKNVAPKNIESAPVIAPMAEPPKVGTPPVAVPKVELPKIVPPKAEVPPAPPLDAKPERPVLPTLPPPPPSPPAAADLLFPKDPVPEAPVVPEPVVTPAPQPVVTPAPPVSSSPALPSGGPSAARVDGNTLIVAFAADAAVIVEAAKPLLNELAERLVKDEGLSVQFLAYAGGDEAQASKARRLSLTRALTVRQFFLDRGVRSTRMEVRAMGSRGASNRQPTDRVEIVVVSR